MSRSNNVLEPNLAKDYQAKLVTPFAILGIRTSGDWLTDIEYLSLDTSPLKSQNHLAKEVCNQLQAYLVNPSFIFDLSLHISGTTHQRRVWQAIKLIPSGSTCSYADIASKLRSAPRAVGQACGANRLPMVIPCHRVISRNGEIGGFMNASNGFPLDIKRWLLRHECS